MRGADPNVSDEPTQMGPAGRRQSRRMEAEQPTMIDAKSATLVTRLPGWSLGSTQLAAGTRLFEYEVTGTIGQGGFGIVYRAVDRLLGRNVAIKEYLPATMVLRSD